MKINCINNTIRQNLISQSLSNKTKTIDCNLSQITDPKFLDKVKKDFGVKSISELQLNRTFEMPKLKGNNYREFSATYNINANGDLKQDSFWLSENGKYKQLKRPYRNSDKLRLMASFDKTSCNWKIINNK